MKIKVKGKKSNGEKAEKGASEKPAKGGTSRKSKGITTGLKFHDVYDVGLKKGLRKEKLTKFVQSEFPNLKEDWNFETEWHTKKFEDK